MSRARNIKPGFFKNDLLAECHPLARILFAGLWCEADREGRLRDRPKRIKADCLPYDDCDVEELLCQLADRGFITRYAVDGARFIEIPEFGKHQNPHVREPASQIPAQCKHSASTVQEPEQHEPGPADSPSLIPEELPPSAAQKAAPPEVQKPASEPDPIFGHGLAFLLGKGVKEKGARSFLGAMRKELGDLLAAELLAAAEREDVSDPIPWLRKAGETRRTTGPPKKPNAADMFHGKTYTGTPIDDLPPELRDAVRAELAAG